MKVKILIAVMLLVTTAAESKVPCEKGPKSEDWHWRSVNGKRCWYNGERRIRDRDELYWRAGTAAVPAFQAKAQVQQQRKSLSPNDYVAEAFALVGSQAQSEPGFLPLALTSVWLGLPIDPTLQPVPPAEPWPDSFVQILTRKDINAYNTP
jgi:hypothetical protein